MDMLTLEAAGSAGAVAAGSPGFDYGAMDAETAREGRAAVERYRGRSRAYMMDTGRDLLAMKARLDHGLFLRWVDAEMGLTPRTAQNFMQAATQLGDKSEIVSHLPPTVLYKLAAPSTPEPVRAAVLRRIEAGETIKPAAIVEEIDEAKAEARKQANDEREAARRAALSDDARAAEDARANRQDKSKAARARREDEARQARLAEEAAARAESALGAAFLIDRLGADTVAALIERFGQRGGLQGLLSVAADEAAIARAKLIAPTDLQASRIYRSGKVSPFANVHDADAIQALAAEIEADGLREPVIVRKNRSGLDYEVVEGSRRYLALVDVLGRNPIPVRIVPRAPKALVDAFGSEAKDS